MKTQSAHIVVITPEMASDILSKNTHNRNLSKRHVGYLASAMKRGEWVLNGESIVISEDGTLLDGQHRLAACVQSNTPFESWIVKGVDASCYSTYDQGKKRSGGDTLSVENIPNSNAVAAIIGNYYAKHMGLSLSTARSIKFMGDKSLSNSMILEMYDRDKEFWQYIHAFVKKLTNAVKFVSASTVGGWASYLIKDRLYPTEKVEDFFTQIFIDGNATHSATKLLRGRLLNELSASRKTPPAIIEQLFIKAWNAYKKGAEMKTLRFVIESEAKQDWN